MKYRLPLVLIILAMVPAYAQVAAGTKAVAAAGGDEVTRTQTTVADGANLPAEAQSNISAVVGRDDRSYKINYRSGALQAENTPQQLSAVFNAGGVQIRTGKSGLGMKLLAYGYGDLLLSVPAAVPHADVNRVEYRRGPLTEWYVNGPAGLEQGFTLAEPPAQKRNGPLTIALSLSGDLATAPEQSNTELTLKDHNRTEKLRYAGLTSYDSTGRQLQTSLEVRSGQLRLKVEDAGAVYPLVVDPWLYAAKLTASDGTAYSYFGNAASVSTDGKTVVIGALQSTVSGNFQQGAVYVFAEPRAGWKTTSTFTAKLTASDGAAGDSFGESVAISTDSKTIVVGAPEATVNNNVGQGAVYVYIQPATGGWKSTSQFAAKLLASDGNAYDWLGSAVSYRGSTVVAGADDATVGSNPAQGAAYVFVKPATGWTNATQNAKLVSSDGGMFDQFGCSISSTTSTLVVGAYQANVSGNIGQGSAYVFVQPAGGWSGLLNQNAKLTASNGLAEDLFGSSVVMSADAATIAVGAQAANINGNGGQGAVYVFAQPAGGWTGSLNEIAQLTASDGLQEDDFGYAVSMNTGANTIVVGAPLAPNSVKGPGAGKGYIFVKPKTGGWVTTSTFSQELKSFDGRVGFAFGSATGVNSNTLVVGSMGACIPSGCKGGSKSFQGAAYIWRLH